VSSLSDRAIPEKVVVFGAVERVDQAFQLLHNL